MLKMVRYLYLLSNLPVNNVVLSMNSLTEPTSKPRDNLYIGIDSTVDDTGSKTFWVLQKYDLITVEDLLKITVIIIFF